MKMSGETLKTLLLVEDEILIAKEQKRVLENFRYRVVLAANGEEALEIFRTKAAIDLVLMDIDLGEGLDGTEVVDLLLKERAVPIIFLTNHTEGDFVKKTESCRSYGYVVKNSTIDVLDVSIKMALALFEANQKVVLSEESLSITLQSIGDAFIATDTDGKITKMNKTAERLTGWTFSEAKNKPLSDVFIIVQEGTKKVLANSVARVMECGETIGLVDNAVLMSRDGGTYQIFNRAAPIRDGQGIIRGAILVFSDVSDKQKGERLLRESYNALEHSQNLAHICSWTIDLVKRTSNMSDEGKKIFGFTLNDVPSFDDILACIAREDIQAAYVIYENATQTGQPFNFEMKILKKNNSETRTLMTHAEILFDLEAKPIAIRGTSQDITERKQVENKLRESEERYKRITDGLNDYLYTVKVKDSKPVETIHNEACLAITGYSINEFYWDPYLWINMVVPEEREKVAGRFQKILDGNALPTFEHRIICKDGTIRWISDTAIPKYDCNGTLISYDGVIKDISGRKYAEEKVKSLLSEKELILKEVHHRIKNNMNTINSLLNLQAGTLKDKSAIMALEDAGRRVRSMMMLYDKLYRSDFFNEMSIAQYLPSLVDEILVNFPNAKSVSVVKHIDDFVLDVKRLQSIGIIVNELLTNIMKYAFKERNFGEISVTVYLINQTVSITIGDNGDGLPESVDFEHSTGFGLMLVGVLTKQLRGRLRIERENGTKIVLEFEL